MNKLPYQRYDEFVSVVKSLETMKITLNDHSKCKNNDKAKCLWPKLHSNIDLIKSGEFKIGPEILMEKESDPQILTRQATELSISQTVDDVEKSYLKRLDDLVSRIRDDMLGNVYTKEEEEMIQVIRRLTDWSTLAFRINRLGPVLIETLESSQYLLDSRKILRSLRDVPDCIITNQFKIFVHRLHKETKNMPIDNITNTDSKDFIKQFLKTELYIYKDMEMIIAATVVGCIKLGIESPAESMISKYNLHSSHLSHQLAMMQCIMK